jgi:hypothetical protein
MTALPALQSDRSRQSAQLPSGFPHDRSGINQASAAKTQNIRQNFRLTPVTPVTRVRISLLIVCPPSLRELEIVMPRSIMQLFIGIAVATGFAVVGVSAIGGAVAQSPLDQALSTTNRYESPVSETDFQIGDHQQLRNIFFSGDRLR